MIASSCDVGNFEETPLNFFYDFSIISKSFINTRIYEY